MSIYRKRRIILTVICAAITLALFAYVIAVSVQARRDGIFTEGWGILAAAIFCIPLWDAYISFRYFLGDPRMKTGFFTFANVFALFTAALTVFEFVNIIYNPFRIAWMNWITTPAPMKAFMGVCSFTSLADVILRLIYLLMYNRQKKAVGSIYDGGAQKFANSLDKPPLV